MFGVFGPEQERPGLSHSHFRIKVGHFLLKNEVFSVSKKGYDWVKEHRGKERAKGGRGGKVCIIFKHVLRWGGS